MADPGAPKDDLRAITDRMKSLETRLRELETPSGTQRELVVQRLQETVDNMQAVIDEQADQTAALAAQVAFLQTQTLYAAHGTLTSYTGTNPGLGWVTFNPAYDVSMNVTTGASGFIVATVSGLLTGGGLTGLLGIEVVGVTGPSYGAASAMSTDGTSSPSRPVGFQLAANTTYLLRTRRGIDGAATGVVIWGYQSLTVNRLG